MQSHQQLKKCSISYGIQRFTAVFILLSIFLEMISLRLISRTRINISLKFLHIVTQVSFSSYDSLIYSLFSKDVSILKVPQSSMRQNVMANSDKVRTWKESGHGLFQVTIVANWERLRKTRKTSAMTVIIPAEFRTRHVPNASLNPLPVQRRNSNLQSWDAGIFRGNE